MAESVGPSLLQESPSSGIATAEISSPMKPPRAPFPSSLSSKTTTTSQEAGMDGQERKPPFIHRLVVALRDSLAALGAQPTNRQLESWACLIHESMSVYGRYFHSVQHVFDISGGADPIQVVSALFHDCIYCNVDGGLLPKQADLLRGIISDRNEDNSKITLSHLDSRTDPMLSMVASVFGFTAGQVLDTHFSGENEFLSAVLAVRCMEGTLQPSELMQIAACIEMTIPFRRIDDDGLGPADRLFRRLCEVNEAHNLDLGEEELVVVTQRAVDVGNRDVGNFCTTDTPWFLDNTWKLLPESNVPLRRRHIYKVYEFQQALKNMYGFFSNLNYKVVFNSFRGSPSDVELAAIRRRTKRNIEIARLYIRAKLVSVSVIAALAELTGGDAPMALFVGDMPTTNYQSDRLDDFIPLETLQIRNGACVDEEVFDLLKTGRKSDCKFDLRNSPLAAYLYGLLGNLGVDESLSQLVIPMDEVNSLRLLKSIPLDAIEVVVESCAKIALTRADVLMQVLHGQLAQ